MVGLKVVLCVIIAVTGANASGCGFAYDGDLGPDHWSDAYSQCKGKHQSPINIDSEHVDRIVMSPLKLQGFYYTEGETILTNNGHTAMMTTNATTLPTISGGPLGNSKYIFSQLHFHWGKDDMHGSEDEIDGKCYTMEMHMVFYKEDYLDSTSALDYSDGLTVLATLIQVGETHNHNYNGFVKVLPEIVLPETEVSFEQAPALYNLLPHDLTHYFTYNGSLTTPPCSEAVIWIDFKEPVILSHEQIETFRALRNEENETMSNNFRAIQPLGDRIVRYNVNLFEMYMYKTQSAQEFMNTLDEMIAEFE